MQNYFILLICLILVSCSTQEESESVSNKEDLTIRIDLNTNYDAPGRGFTILSPLSEMEDSLISKITFPDLSDISDTSFAQIYFTGKNHSAIEKGVFVIIGNHASKSPLIWVDYDNNLDFSDAENPHRFSENFIDITIPNMDEPMLFHTIRFHKPDVEKKAEMKKMLEQYITKGKIFSDFFMDERRNIFVGDFLYKKDSLRIGLIDWDVNGSYNDIGTDRLLIGEYGGKISGTEESEGAIVLDSVTYFQAANYAFEVLEVSTDGKSILIQPTAADKIASRIKEGDAIADYSFKLFSGIETSVKKYLNENKYVYLNFWASWCAGCGQEVDDLKKIHSEYSEKVTIISLNYNENAEKIKSFLDKFEIKWLNGYSTEEINEKLLIQGLPRNILIDPSGKIIEMNIHPSKLLERIEKF